MPGETFDTVIIGGGTKAPFLAMYLIKYGGMSIVRFVCTVGTIEIGLMSLLDILNPLRSFINARFGGYD